MRITLDEVLLQQNKSMYWLCKQTGITPPTMSALYHNKTNRIGFDTLEKICKALQCSPNDLIKIEE